MDKKAIMAAIIAFSSVIITSWSSQWLFENYPEWDPTVTQAVAAAITAFIIYYLFIKRRKA